MKKAEIIFSTILVPLDYILLILAGLYAYCLRYSNLYTTNIREVVFNLSWGEYFKVLAVAAFVWLVIFALAGLYSMRPDRKMFDVFSQIFLACSTGTLIVIVTFFFSRELFSSRFIILAAWGLAIVYVNLAHLTVRLIQRWLYKKNIGVHKIILVGQDQTSHALAQEFKRNVKLGCRIVYWTEDFNQALINKTRELAKEDKVDEIVQTDPNFSREATLNLIDLASEYHLDFKYAADLLGARRTNFEIKTVNGIPLVEIKKTPLDGWGKVAKRLFDIAGALCALLIFSPVFLILPLIIKLDSKGAVIYKTERVGAKEKKFNLYKFRSMIQGADKLKEELMENNERLDGPLFKMKKDPRITRAGKFIRQTSFDELPNFWNVLIGNMSLVGPRPHEPNEVAKYKKHHKKLLNIKPGITGMAQVSGRSMLYFETEVKLDTLYIETWSLRLDLIILFKTPLIIFKLID